MNDVLEGNPSDAMNRILLNFLQVISVFAAFPLKWPEPVLELFRISMAISVLGESLVNPDCELSWSPSTMFYNKMLGWAGVPPVVVFLCMLGWRGYACCHRLPWRKEVSRRERALHSKSKKPGRSTHYGAENDKAAVALGSGESKMTSRPVQVELTGIGTEAPPPSRKEGRHRVKDSSLKMLRTSMDDNFKDWVATKKVSYLEASDAFRKLLLSKLKQRIPTPKDHFCVCSVILLYLCYPSICKNTFRLVVCTKVGDELYLSADPEKPCWTGQHLLMFWAVCLPQFFVYVLGMPLLALVVLYKNRHRLENARTKYRWGVLFVGLRPERYYWDFVVCLRKAAVFSLSVLGSTGDNLAIQTHLAMLVLFLSLLAHLVGRPYEPEWYLLDVFEVSGLVVCWVLMWSGIIFYLDGMSLDHQEFATVCLMCVNVAYAVGVGTILIRQKAQEGATWTVLLRKKVCCKVSDESLKKFGALLPAINPSTRYLKEMEDLRLRKSFHHVGGAGGGSTGTEFSAEKPSLSGSESGHRRDLSSSVEWSHNPKHLLELEQEAANAHVEGKSGQLAQLEEGLPDGWFVDLDPSSGAPYYFTLEGRTSWTRPRPRAITVSRMWMALTGPSDSASANSTHGGTSPKRSLRGKETVATESATANGDRATEEYAFYKKKIKQLKKVHSDDNVEPNLV
jgi:hypothetical protein